MKLLLLFISGFLIGASATAQTLSPPGTNCNPYFTSSVSGYTATFSFSGSMPCNWQWDFGDGNQHFQQNSISHTYSTPGTYIVCAEVVAGCGSACSWCDTILVPGTSACQPAFTYTIHQDTAFFHFTGSMGCNWQWIFGDGDSAFQQNNISHVYSGSGPYVACVRGFGPCDTCSSCDTISFSTGIPSGISNSTLQLFPNPAGEATMLRYGCCGASWVTLSDLNGRIRWSSREAAQATHQVLIPLHELPGGIYIISVGTAAGMQRAKLLVRSN